MSHCNLITGSNYKRLDKCRLKTHIEVCSVKFYCLSKTSFHNIAKIKTLFIIAFVVGISYATPVKRAVKAQNPGVWSALDKLSGRNKLTNEDMYNLFVSARAGQDYPTYNANDIPQGSFDCATMPPGYYADTDFKCQVVRRCDVNANMSSYICPNMTLFNQITLVCHWFWEVDCNQAKNFYDYSNSRLYQVVCNLYTLTWDVRPIPGKAKSAK